MIEETNCNSASNHAFLLQAQNEAPFLMKFEGGWAIRAIMTQYLRNRSARERKLSQEIKVLTIFSESPDILELC